MLGAFVKFIRAMSSNTAPAEIAHAFAWGVFFGLMPKNNALWYILFVLVFFLRIQRGVLSLTTLIVGIFAYLADPLLDTIGCWILTRDYMQAPMIKVMNIPFVAFSKINNSIVMGSLGFLILSYIPLFLFSLLFTFLWRRYLGAKLKNLKIVKMFGKIPLVRKISDLSQEF